MVPFYGQGLNCGLEDVRVFYYVLLNHNVDASYVLPGNTVDDNLANALNVYTESRHEDLVTISDLAMDN